MEFFCENPAAGHADDRIWKGYVKQFRRHGDTVEADISGKGSAMHVIIGRYEYGRYLCIPDCMTAFGTGNNWNGRWAGQTRSPCQKH